MESKIDILLQQKTLTLLGRGGALFSDGYFYMKKGVWRSKISWLFLIHYELSENQKKIVFSQCFGVISPPLHSSNIRKPCPIVKLGLKLKHWFPSYCILTFIVEFLYKNRSENPVANSSDIHRTWYFAMLKLTENQ